MSTTTTSFVAHIRYCFEIMRLPFVSSLKSKDARHQFHKPLILRVPGLLFIFVITLALIAILEHAARSLPVVSDRKHILNFSQLGGILQKRKITESKEGESEVLPQECHASISLLEVPSCGPVIAAREPQTVYMPTASSIARGIVGGGSDSKNQISIPFANPLLISSTRPTAYLPITSDTIPALLVMTSVTSAESFLIPTTKPIDYVPITATSQTLTQLPHPSPALYLPNDSTSTPTQRTTSSRIESSAYMSTGDYLPIYSTRTTKATTPSGYLLIETTSTIAIVSTDPVVDPQTTSSPTIYSSTDHGAYLAPITTDATVFDSISAYLVTVTGVLTSTSLSTDSLGGVATVLSSYTAIQTQQIITKTESSAFITTDAAGQTRQTTVPYTKVQTTLVTSTNIGSTPQEGNQDPQTVLVTWPVWWIFVAGYLPLILAIFIKMFWTSVDANVKLIDPFIQLSKPNGALAIDALHHYYLSSNFMPDPILSFLQGRWLIFWTSIVYVLVGILSPLASEVLFLDIHYDCGADTCWPPRLSADGPVLRLLQGLFSLIALMVFGVMFMIYKSNTGVYSNVSSIASVATLMHHHEVLDDFRNLDDDISSENMKLQLAGKRYKMGTYQRKDGVWRYGIIPVRTGNTSQQVTASVKPEKKRTHRISTALDIGFVVFALGVLGVVVAYYVDGTNSGFNRFFNSNAFGPRFLMSFVGTLIAMYWSGIEKNIQTLTPFRRLISSPAPAKPTIFFPRHSLPPLTLYTSLTNHHFFAALISLTTLLADILTITLSVIPFSPNEVYLELLICSYTSMAILGIMILVVIGLLFWKRKVGDMPRKPDTLAGVMSYLCDSHFLGDLEGCEGLRGRELERRVGGTGKRFGFGRFVGVDGRKRWMVDEVGVVL